MRKNFIHALCFANRAQKQRVLGVRQQLWNGMLGVKRANVLQAPRAGHCWQMMDMPTLNYVGHRANPRSGFPTQCVRAVPKHPTNFDCVGVSVAFAASMRCGFCSAL